MFSYKSRQHLFDPLRFLDKAATIEALPKFMTDPMVDVLMGVAKENWLNKNAKFQVGDRVRSWGVLGEMDNGFGVGTILRREVLRQDPRYLVRFGPHVVIRWEHEIRRSAAK